MLINRLDLSTVLLAGVNNKLLLMTDLDGTLLELAPTPDRVTVSEELLEVLTELVRHQHVIGPVIISGRSLENLQQLLPVNGLILVGQHGTHLRDDRGNTRWIVRLADISQPLKSYKEKLQELVAGKNGFFIEDKKLVIALHYRLAGEQEAETVAAQAERLAKPLLNNCQLEIIKGKKILELRPKGLNKAAAVNYFCKSYPKALPVYLGDDTTDEDAFRALARGGIGVLIAEQCRPTAAGYRLANTAEVLSFLKSLTGRKE